MKLETPEDVEVARLCFCWLGLANPEADNALITPLFLAF